MSRRAADVPTLVSQARDGAPRAVARLISLVEDASPLLREVMAELAPYTGHAHIIGITGSPGVGKSTSTNALVTAFRVPVEVKPKPFPVLPAPLSKLLPADVRAARRRSSLAGRRHTKPPDHATCRLGFPGSHGEHGRAGDRKHRGLCRRHAAQSPCVSIPSAPAWAEPLYWAINP